MVRQIHFAIKGTALPGRMPFGVGKYAEKNQRRVIWPEGY